ncbi:MAG: serine/threonine-protein kinase [Chiayiivirga sp.]|jgi:serine/threonine protein kinase|uniref:serine/threonine-protein kinase n=1 Tax=Chiayiivirga sp. TaxID=2041042 RepID=UPI0025BA0452|nr:serine/threonine-protein kinase [Chiayiivirga sp.]MCI1710029.1 serine/threonine-protein kinase [Chiayiivirga sp.]MCI1730454.1 serine/threonine-protein kinase [Chiayiivirga sp.]
MNESRWQQLSGLIDELFELDASERARRLGLLETGDADLAHELRRLLAADERSGLLDAGVACAAPTVMSDLARADGPASARAEAGKRLGHYRLVERVGSGGMGEVWRGERVDDFEQQVAIKLIRPLLDSPHLRERFARERRILARLDHPGIARLLDGGVAEDGTPWYAMEFVRGLPLTAHADVRELDVRARVEMLLQVCDATAHAHAQLVVHRDLKPSNVLVDAQGRIRVLDFGIARLLDESADTQLTGTGVRVFSPAYAAPEQIRGDAVGTAADVFALGAVLFELLAGRVPHPHRSMSPERLLALLQDEVAPRPSQAVREATGSASAARGTSTARQLSGDLDTIVTTALQPEAARRYAGAAQLADDLRRWLDGRPIAAQPDTAGYRMRKFVARHRFAVGSASAVLLALVGGLGLALWQASVARDHAARADAQAALASSEAARAEREATQARALAGRVKHAKEFFVSAFFQADPMRRAAQGPMTVDAAFDALLERARTELANDPVLQADVLDDFGEIRANQGRFDEARELFDKALAVAEREFGPNHPAVAESLLNLAFVANFRGDEPVARSHIERAVAILEADDGGDPLALANALNSHASTVAANGDTQAALPIARRSIDLYRQHGPDSPQRIGALTNLGTMLSNASQLEASDAALNEAVAAIEAQQGQDAATLWPVLTSLAANAFIRGDATQEAAYTERALAIARASFPGAHPWKASAMVDRGLQVSRGGDWARGEPMMREGIAIYDELGSPDVVAALRQLAIAQRSHDDHRGALDSLERAYATCLQHARESHLLCLAIRANRALLMASTGQPARALAEADAALAGLRGDETRYSEQGQAMEARAAALDALGRHPEARAELDAVIALLAKNFGPEHPETRRVRAARSRLD